MSLPTPEVNPGRDFGGQRFVRHEAAAAIWRPWGHDGLEARDLGIAAATDGVAGAQVLRTRVAQSTSPRVHDAELLFLFVLRGAATLACRDRSEERLGAGDAVVVPAGLEHELHGSEGLELLEVTLPGRGP